MRYSLAAALTLGAAAPAAGLAQSPPAQQPTAAPLDVGTVAPDFALPGATRYGVLKNPIHLSDFKGKTVVLAFFIEARTKG
jgi:cytochrome oxidase Cu insertion factor (SCO1/SenC/PrrC family)